MRGRVAIAVVTVGVAIAVVFTVGGIIPVGFATPTPPATTTALGFPFAIIVIVRAIVLVLPAIAVAGRFIVSIVRICFRIDIQIIDLVHDGGINRHHMFDRRDNACRGLELFKREIGADQSGVAFDAHGHAIAAFDMGDMFALLVHQEVGDADGRGDQYLARPFAGALFLDLAQDRQRKVVVRPDQAGAVAGVARLGRRLDHTGTQTLARHFHQAKAGNTAHLNTRTVGFQLFLHQLFNGGVIATLVHVDKVDDDQTGQITQTQLTSDFGGGFKIGLGRGLFDGAFLGGPARVHVDRNKRFGHTDHDIATRRQLYRGVEHARQVAFDLIACEQGQCFAIELHVLGVGRHDHLHEVLGDAVTAFTFDKHLVNLAVIKVADRAFDQVAFFIDLGGRDGFQRQLADLFPQALQVFVVALDLGLGALCTGGAHDQTGTFWHLNFVCDLFQLLTVRGVGDLAADAAPTRGVGHEHTIAAGQRQIGCQRGTFVATFLFNDLHQQDLTHLDDFLDFIALGPWLARGAQIVVIIVIRHGFDAVILGGRIFSLGAIVAVIRVVAVVLIIGIRFCGVFRICFGGLGSVTLCLAVIAVWLFDRRFGNPLHRRGAFFIVQIDGLHAVDLVAVGGIGVFADGRVIGHGVFGLGLAAAARACPAFGLFVFVFLGGLRFGIGTLFLHQRQTVGDGDLVVIGVNFRKGEETMTVAAIIHKRGL